MDKLWISAKVERSLKLQLQAEASRQGVTMSEVIRQACDTHLARATLERSQSAEIKREKQKRAILEAYGPAALLGEL